MSAMVGDCDVAVIGAGVVGLACAYELAGLGLRVTVFDRGEAGSGASRQAAGMLAPASEAEAEDQALVALAVESCKRYPGWVAELEHTSQTRCGYRTEGSLLVALHRSHLEEIDRLAQIQTRLGLATTALTRDEMLARESNLSPRVIGGLFAPEDRQINPRWLTIALQTALCSVGGTIDCHADVAPSLQAGRVAGVEGRAGAEDVHVRAEVVVLAGGAWSGSAWPETAGSLPLRPVKGQILRLRGAALIDHVVRTPDIYLVPREDGELVVGATSEEQGFDPATTAGAVMDLLRHAWLAVPGVAELELAETGVGFRPALRDNLPAIGPTGIEGLYAATGHYRHGVMLAPITGMLIAEMVRGGPTPALLKPFDPRRFGQPAVATGVVP